MDVARYVYSKFKSTALFYTTGVHIFEFTEIEFNTILVKLVSPTNNEHYYEVISVDQSDSLTAIHLKNVNSGTLGVLKILPFDRAEFSFGAGRTIHLKK